MDGSYVPVAASHAVNDVFARRDARMAYVGLVEELVEEELPAQDVGVTSDEFTKMFEESTQRLLESLRGDINEMNEISLYLSLSLCTGLLWENRWPSYHNVITNTTLGQRTRFLFKTETSKKNQCVAMTDTGRKMCRASQR